jgi:SAM-dependent methyltransferase
MKILLGCGDEVREGWVHHDLWRHSPHVQVVHDLAERPWPWPNSSAEKMVARHVLEHLQDTVGFMDEAWRVLRPGGTLEMAVPHCDGENAWKDPTHVKAFHPEAFTYFDPEQGMGRMFGRFYTERYWRVLTLVTDGVEIVVLMEKRG